MKRRLTNPLALVILSLLSERPMHPYEIAAQMRQRGLQEQFKLNYGSLYSVIEVLQREGLVLVHGTERAGRLPERTIYTVSEAGRTEFLSWLRSVLRTPVKEYPQFKGGLSLLSHLQPAEAVALLEERLRLVREEIASREGVLASAMAEGVERLFLIEEEYGLAGLEADAVWMQKFLNEVRDGTLAAVQDGVLVWKITWSNPVYQGALNGLEGEKG